MGKTFFRSLVIALVGMAWGIRGQASELVVYAYDSFLGHHSWGAELIPLFEKKCGCRLRVLPTGNAEQIVSRLQIDRERGKTVANVVVGLDLQGFERARNRLEDNEIGESGKFVEAVRKSVSRSRGFAPIDYGYFAWMDDRENLKGKVPSSLSDLLDPALKRSLILEDPRTSAPGLAFLLYTHAILGENAWEFWKNLRSQWLTLAPGWSGAYGLFLKKEAPLVWSYTTSQAYHQCHGAFSQEKKRYQALLFREGQPMHVEGAAIVKGSFSGETRKLARAFVEFLISPEAQALVPEHQWMFPTLKNVPLPACFQDLPAPQKTVPLAIQPEEVNQIMRTWSRVVGDVQ